MTTDPMRYHDQLNAAVVEALQGVSAKMDEVSGAMSSQAQMLAATQRALLELSQRQIALELRHDKLELRVNGVEALAGDYARRRRTDAPVYAALAAARDIALIVAILFVGWGLARIAATLAEVISR